MISSSQSLKNLFEHNTMSIILDQTQSKLSFTLNDKIVNQYLSDLGFKVELTNDEINQMMTMENSNKLISVIIIEAVLRQFSRRYENIFSQTDIDELLNYPIPHLVEMLEKFVLHIDPLDLNSDDRYVYSLIEFKNTTSKLTFHFEKLKCQYTVGIEIHYDVEKDKWSKIDDEDECQIKFDERENSHRFYQSTPSPKILSLVSEIFSGGETWLIEPNERECDDDPYQVTVCLSFDEIAMDYLRSKFDLYPLFRILMVQFEC